MLKGGTHHPVALAVTLHPHKLSRKRDRIVYLTIPHRQTTLYTGGSFTPMDT